MVGNGRFEAVRRRWARRRGRARLLDRLEWTACPPSAGTSEHHLLLVHHRKVVGEFSYRLCDRCPAGQMTTTRVPLPLSEGRVVRRAMSHLRFRHPDRSWLPQPAVAGTRTARRRYLADSRFCEGHDSAGYSLPASTTFSPEPSSRAAAA
ncbi:hypothetical protein ACMZ5F_04005 [Streptomyces rhizosphaericola]|uniref:hypothetical protein n=1 Tax=Streptomyces TaxID=1883 RepID=UPI001E28A338|nr:MULTISPECIES: hypothetical protein [unclassified Streptomyces]